MVHWPRTAAPFEQTLLPHTVPITAGLHAPNPSQPPAVQLVADAGQAGSAVPAPAGLHVPLPLKLHRLQAPHEGDWQHTPSTQEVDAHSAPVEHMDPAVRPTHMLPLQTGWLAGQSEAEQQPAVEMHIVVPGQFL